MPHAVRSYLLISRRRIADNYHAIRRAAGPGVEVACVVKADAYGHGAAEVSRVLEAAGARWLAVSTVAEGVELREAGIAARILVLAGCLPFEREAVVRCALTPCLPALDSIAEIEEMARASERRLPYHLKIDSGMGRLGTRAAADRIAATVDAAPHAQLEGLMSHFASAGDFTSPQTEEQAARFSVICEDLRARGIVPAWRHIAATNAVCFSRGVDGNMARVGVALFGYVEPPAGAALGSGATFRARRPMRVAAIAAGFADGVRRGLSNCGRVIAGGRVAPILGVVSMDLTLIDAGQAPGLRPGDEVTLLGTDGPAALDPRDIAAVVGTTLQEVLCGIGRRVRRVYV